MMPTEDDDYTIPWTTATMLKIQFSQGQEHAKPRKENIDTRSQRTAMDEEVEISQRSRRSIRRKQPTRNLSQALIQGRTEVEYVHRQPVTTAINTA